MLDEAKKHPNGSVCVIDPRFDRDGAIPSWAVLRAWTVDANGIPTGEAIENPYANIRTPLRSVEQLLAEIKVFARTESEFELFISSQMTVNDAPVDDNIGMAIIGDSVLSVGFWPVDRRDFEEGFAYRYRKSDGASTP